MSTAKRKRPARPPVIGVFDASASADDSSVSSGSSGTSSESMSDRRDSMDDSTHSSSDGLDTLRAAAAELDVDAALDGLNGVGPDLEAMTALAEATLDAYAEATADQTAQERIAYLQQLEHDVFGIYAAHPGPDFADLPQAGRLAHLLTEIEALHTALIVTLKARAVDPDTQTLLPFSTAGMDADTIGVARDLWESICREEGDIVLEGTEDFTQRQLGNLARIMSKPRGLALLSFLDEDAGKPITLRESDGAPVAGPVDNTEADLTAVDAEADGPDLSPEQLMQSVYDSSDANVQLGGRSFARHAGSAVNVDLSSEYQDGRSLGEDQQEIHTPEFITVAHELGHAAKAKGGAKGTNVPFEVAAPGESGNDWDNSAEEFLNVKGVENPIREEHGIAQRGNYRALKQVRQTRLQLKYNDRISAAMHAGGDTTELMAIIALAQDNGLSDDQTFADIDVQMEARLSAVEGGLAAPSDDVGSSSGGAPKKKKKRGGFFGFFKKKK